MSMVEVIHYLDENGSDLHQDWLDGLRDRIAKIAVIKRVARGLPVAATRSRSYEITWRIITDG